MVGRTSLRRIILGLLMALAPLARAAEDVDLGIPLTAPWEDPAEVEKARAEAKARAAHPLERRFWKRLAADAASVEAWRGGLLEAVRYARGRPTVFPPQPTAREGLFREYRDVALATWIRAMDHWLALDALVRRYGEFAVLSDRRQRNAAFLVAYAGYLAQARFAREWTGLAGNDPHLEGLFDEPVPSLGLPGGAYTAIKERFRGPGASEAAGAVRAYARAVDAKGALGKVLGRRLKSWRLARRRDRQSLPKGVRRGLSGRALAALVRERAFSGTFPVRSAASAWGEEFKPQVLDKQALLLPPLEGSDVTVSSEIIYAIETVRHWFQLEPPEGPRPEVLISSGQVRKLAKAVLPGDILLVRRERYLSEIGQPGFWHHASLYVGSEAERREFFGGDFVNEHLRASIPEAYRNSVAEDGREQPSVLEAGPRGVVFSTLAEAAAADYLAVLRPRGGPDERAKTLLRAFRHHGKPFDRGSDVATEAAVGSAELVYAIYAPKGAGLGLRAPAAEVLGRRTVWPNMLARTFDAEFGTDEQQLEWICYLAAREERHDVRVATMEEFRRSWKRPKWTLEERE